MGDKKKYKVIDQEQLVDVFKDIKDVDSKELRICFLLGAGASVSSKIPLGRTLAARWYEELEGKITGEERKEWEEKVGTTLNEATVGEFYTYLYERRFRAAPQLGDEVLKGWMEKSKPSIGYVILAQILAKERHNFVITTNFDFLVEDAVRSYTSKKPFVAGHEMLAKFVSSQTERPTIIKVHRDLFLHPLNDTKGTATLDRAWQRALSPILCNFSLVVVGYGGNDGSLMKYLEEMKDDRKPIYWCAFGDEKVCDKVENLLTEQDFLVKIRGFDSLMCGLNEALQYDEFKKLDTPDEHPFVIAAKERVKALKEGLEKYGKENPEDADALENAVEGAMGYLLKAYGEKDAVKKEAVFKEGMGRYPTSVVLICEYAFFLDDAGRYEESCREYARALEVGGEDAGVNNDWGIVLYHWAETKEGQEAERLYREALRKYGEASRLNPDDGEVYNNWGTALSAFARTKSGMESDELYRAAFQKYGDASRLKPDDMDVYYNWGNVLSAFARTKSGEESEKLYWEAFQKYGDASRLNPDDVKVYYNWGNALSAFAFTKSGVESDELYREALRKYGEASRLKPDDGKVYNNWGSALYDFALTKSGVESDELYREAFQKYGDASRLKPSDVKVYNNWGSALCDFARTKSGVESDELYREALRKYVEASRLKPSDGDVYNHWGNALCYFALTKSGVESDGLYREAFQKYGEASRLKPDDVKIYNNWGSALYDFARTKSGVESDGLYREAFQKYGEASRLKPDDVKVYNNWGSALYDFARTKSGDESDELYRESFLKYFEALRLAPDALNVYNNLGYALCGYAKTKAGVGNEELFRKTLAKLEEGVELGGNPYNLACVYAILGDKEQALHYLEESLWEFGTRVDFVREDEDWATYRDDPDFKALLARFETGKKG